jgi:hypothetical protein
MTFTVVLNNGKKFHLLYSAQKFETGLTVTGYFIYPDLQKSQVFSFSELDDGVYAVEVTNDREKQSNVEKYGIVIKENGEVKKFDVIQIVY